MDQKKPFKQPVKQSQKPDRPVFNSNEDEKRAYDILWQRHLNDDRLSTERTNLLMVANSLLFLAFVYLLSVSSTDLLRISVAVVGILLCLLSAIGGFRSIVAMNFWMKHEFEMEQNGRSFIYMRRYGSLPHLMYKYVSKNKLGFLIKRANPGYIYAVVFPLCIFALWVVSLVWIITN